MNNQTLRPIAVFADAENFGSLEPHEWDADLARVLAGVPENLREYGFQPEPIHVFASCHGRRGQPLANWVQKKVINLVRSHGAIMHWSHEIADTALMDYVRGVMVRKALPRATLLLTNDADFIPLVNDLKRQGHLALVAGRKLSRDLAAAAHQTVSLNCLVW